MIRKDTAAELPPGRSRSAAAVLLGIFTAATIGVLAVIVTFFTGMLVYGSGAQRAGALLMSYGLPIAFLAGAWCGWWLIRRSASGHSDR